MLRYGNVVRVSVVSLVTVLALSALSVIVGRVNGLTSQDASRASIALINVRLIDGTGAAPIDDAVVLVDGDRVAAAGPAASVRIPADARRYDLAGATLMPGFIDVHVHEAFISSNLAAWARAGVTTVRDEGTSIDNWRDLPTFQADVESDNRYARLVSAGTMFGSYGGYGSLYVTTAHQGASAVHIESQCGVGAIKISVEDGYRGQHDLPKLSYTTLQAIVDEAHAEGLPVSAHVTQSRYVQKLLELGVDDLAHLPYDEMSPQMIRNVVAADVYAIPTFSFFRNAGLDIDGLRSNLSRFHRAGGSIALGDDYRGDPGRYDLGMPIYDIEMLASSGLSPMDIIVAATKNGAHVIRRDDDLGTIEPGKIADILVVNGDPLLDLHALTNVRLVLHNGEVIRS